MKQTLLRVANIVAKLYQVLPVKFRHIFIKGLFVLESRGDNKAQGLRNLFSLADDLEHVINERALAYGDGVHPKHRLIRYHDFFIERIGDEDCVLDIGCGYGAVARSIAKAKPNAEIAGVDNNYERYQMALEHDNPPNLKFYNMDALEGVPEGPWDVVVLSNVLEHIKDRPGFLKGLAKTTNVRTFLIRVPLFERDWKMPMRREVGANYYSDPDHKIEHTVAEFEQDMEKAGLDIQELNLRWGEIWAKMIIKNNFEPVG